IMLQQTTVAAVKPYFETFLAVWPTVLELAAADREDVLKAWAGLGYYARARNLHKCAVIVAERHGGRFPDARAELADLPGIGPYTAAAIAAIAFDRREAAVDGNVERVIARLFALETPLPDAKPEIAAIAQSLVPGERAGDYAQAMMDLGATVCAPRKANCLICPLSAMCRGRAAGLQDVLPYKRAKAAKPTRYGIAFWVERTDGAVLVRTRPDRGLLGGMSEIPSTEWSADGVPGDPAAQAPVAARWTRLPGIVRHTFTHFHLELEVWAADPVPAGAASPGGRFVPRRDLHAEALPSVMKKVAAHALKT
ncbi:MAG: A/G-specific adenine glycosylase, partial [Hyphomicrobiales bacterium]